MSLIDISLSNDLSLISKNRKKKFDSDYNININLNLNSNLNNDNDNTYDYDINSIRKSLDLNEEYSVINQTNSTINFELLNSSLSISDFLNEEKEKEKEKEKENDLVIEIVEEKDTKSILYELVMEERDYLIKTLTGFIIFHSIDIGEIDVDYLCKKANSLIGELVNYEGKLYKVYIFLFISIYFFIFFYIFLFIFYFFFFIFIIFLRLIVM
jgi:hypothetical protein